jgi:hypothetical protein
LKENSHRVLAVKMSAVERVCAFSSGESTANGRLANPCAAALYSLGVPPMYLPKQSDIALTVRS